MLSLRCMQVIATDMSKHMDHVANLRTRVEMHSLSPSADGKLELNGHSERVLVCNNPHSQYFRLQAFFAFVSRSLCFPGRKNAPGFHGKQMRKITRERTKIGCKRWIGNRRIIVYQGERRGEK